ncbi:MAG: ATP-binding protein [Myxococcales bacterium]|nr:ATP-binding protein [Myxococcales bacterium]
MRALKLLIALRVHELRKEHALSPSEYRGMFLADHEVRAFLGEAQEDVGPLTDINVSRERYIEITRAMSNRVQRSLDAGVYLALPILMHRFSLHPMELKVLLLGLAVDLDQNFKRIFAFVQNNVYKENPSVELITRLLAFTPEERILCRRIFAPDAALRRNNLIMFKSVAIETPLLTEEYVVSRNVVNFVLGSVWLEDDTRYFAAIRTPEADVGSTYVPPMVMAGIERIIDFHADFELQRPIPIGAASVIKNGALLFFTGEPGGGQEQLAHSIAYRLNKRVIHADVRRYFFCPERQSRHMVALFRDARMFNAVLCLENLDAINAPENYYEKRRLIELLRDFIGIAIAMSSKPIDIDTEFGEKLCYKVHFEMPMVRVREDIWRHLVEKDAGLYERINLHFLSRYHQISIGSIHGAVRSAIDHALLNRGPGTAVTTEDLQIGCRAQMNRKLAYLATFVKPTLSWDLLVLPDETVEVLQEIVAFGRLRQTAYTDWGFENRLVVGRGLGVLFSGPPGTGKTMAAGIIAKELDRDLYKVNLASTVSKYIGETEKNLERVFEEAKESNSILLFDEADSLFAKRSSDIKSSTDRYANLEVNYLLQKVEEFEGICILTTNLEHGIDKAFIRRLNFRVRFPFPEAEFRSKLWRSMLPKDTPVEKRIDFDYLAHKFYKLSGGNIKNAVLRGAILALGEDVPVGTRHLDLAGTKECREIGALWKVHLQLDDWVSGEYEPEDEQSAAESAGAAEKESDTAESAKAGLEAGETGVGARPEPVGGGH